MIWVAEKYSSVSDSLIFDGGNRNSLEIQSALATYTRHPTRYGYKNSRPVVLVD